MPFADNRQMAWYFVLLILCLPLVWIILEYTNKLRVFRKFPGIRPRFLVGNLHEFGLLKFKNRDLSISGFYYVRLGLGSIFHREGLSVGWMGPLPIVLITKARTAEVILSSQVLINKSRLYRPMADSLGVGLITSNGDQWRRARKAINPAFNIRIIDDCLDVMVEHSRFLVEVLKQQSQGRKWLDPHPAVGNCVMDILMVTSLGLPVKAHTESAEYADLVNRTVEMIIERIHSPWFHSRIYYLFPVGRKYLKMKERAKEVADQLIARSVTEIKEHEKRGSLSKRKIFVDLLLEMDLTKQEIRDHLNSYVVAGYHTVEAAICWALYLLGRYKDIQSKLYDELCSVFPGGDVEKIDKQQLRDLKYMDCVIKESQRLYSTIPDVGRLLSEDTEIGGYKIPKGTDCLISVSAIHRDPDVYPDPERFDPDRFLPENAAGRSPYAFLPFSIGPRNCIGQRYAEMKTKVIMSHILSHFTVHSLDPEDKVMVFPEIVSRAIEPLKIVFEPRQLTTKN